MRSEDIPHDLKSSAWNSKRAGKKSQDGRRIPRVKSVFLGWVSVRNFPQCTFDPYGGQKNIDCFNVSHNNETAFH